MSMRARRFSEIGRKVSWLTGTSTRTGICSVAVARDNDDSMLGLFSYKEARKLGCRLLSYRTDLHVCLSRRIHTPPLQVYEVTYYVSPRVD